MLTSTVLRTLRRVCLAHALRAMSAYPLRTCAVESASIGAELAGRVLAAPVHALEDAPPFTRSSVDGFAVRAADIAAAASGNVVRLTVAGDVPMGAAPGGLLRPGQAIRVPTGGFLPAGATGVVKKEDCRDLGGAIEIVDGAGSEDHITQQGADVRRGDVLARAGDVLTPASIGMLSGAGVARLELYAAARVALLVTGDEIVSPGAALRPGAVRDINSLSLTAALRAMGFAPVNYDRVADRKDVFAAAFARAFDECDAVVISGGSSVGERDYTPQIVAQAGAPGVIVHGVRAKPGRPTMLAVVGDKPVIGLPGNPVSALVMLETLGKPVLLRLYGKTNDALPYRARLRTRLELDSTLEHLVPVALSRAEDGLEAAPLLGTSSEMHILGHADALVSVPEGSGLVEAGSLVDAVPLSRTTSLR